MVGQRGEDLRAVGLSMPSFWVGLIMILSSPSISAGLPSSGSGTVSTSDALHRARLGLRGGAHASHALVMLEVLGSEYVKTGPTSRAAGSARHLKHALKKRADPGAHAGRINLVIMVNVAMRVETVFAWAQASAACSTRVSLPRASRSPGERCCSWRDDRRRQSRGGHPVRVIDPRIRYET